MLHRNCGPIFSSIGSQRRLEVCRSHGCMHWVIHFTIYLCLETCSLTDWCCLVDTKKLTLYLIRLQHSHSSRYLNRYKCISQGFSSRVVGCFCSKNTGIQQLLSHFCHPKASKSLVVLFPGDVMVIQCSGSLDGEICLSDSR